MMGLDVNGKVMLRAYSVASANYEQYLFHQGAGWTFDVAFAASANPGRSCRQHQPTSSAEKIVLVRGCRCVSELADGEFITGDLPRHEVLGETKLN